MGLYLPRGATYDQRARDAARYETLRAAGSCTKCGAEATHGKTRCTPCGQKNSRRVIERRRERASELCGGAAEKETGR